MRFKELMKKYGENAKDNDDINVWFEGLELETKREIFKKFNKEVKKK